MLKRLSEEERARYRRQLIVPEIGERGQQRIKEATVLIAGLGGLGSIAAYYLAAAGVGHLKIVDMDRVAVHNLNRQILHFSTDIGALKTDSARVKLGALNPWCHIEAMASRIDPDTVNAIVSGCHLIMDGMDNISTRRVLNRASLSGRIPYIFGAVGGLDGMVSTFIPGRTACLECLFPTGTREPSGEIGVIGPAAGVIASLQSIEALKILAGQKPGLAGALMHFHGLSMRLRKTAIDPNPDCHTCSAE
jgi:molybdopterin-synthase adenylyltransferase